MKKNKLFLWRSSSSLLILGFVYAFLYVPIGFVVLFSFNKTSSLGVWGGASLLWYKKLFSNQMLLRAFLNSLKVAFCAASLSVCIGTLCALLFTRFRSFRWSAFFEILSVSPLVIPEVVIGLSFLFFFIISEHTTGFPRGRGLLTITIAHTTVAIAYVSLIVRARLLEIDSFLEEAALDLGAKPKQVFFSITLPLIKPALFASWILAFTLSMDDLVIASFASGPSSLTLPVVVFSTLKTGMTPEINALSTLIVFLVFSLGPMISIWVYKAFKKRT